MLRTVVLGIVFLGFVLCVIPQWTLSVHLMMEHILPKKAHDSEFGGWLKCNSRCFGDKGDVEDITEGLPNLGEGHITAEIRLADVVVLHQRTSYQP